MNEETNKNTIVEFIKEKETKNTIRFKEATDKDIIVIGTIYIQKSFFLDEIPENIKITIEI